MVVTEKITRLLIRQDDFAAGVDHDRGVRGGINNLPKEKGWNTLML